MARRRATPRTSHIDGGYDNRRGGRHGRRRREKSRAPYYILIGILSLGVAVCLVCAAAIHGQSQVEGEEAFNSEKWAAMDPGTRYDIFFDRQTGVYYCMFIRGENMAVTPLFNIDGLPLVVDDVNHSDEGIESSLVDIHNNLTSYEEGNSVG